ncbi:monovalent cation/H+ antiporter subunit E [Methanococcus maripaludis]|nr:monovalent cation/H+ antiporter subunit E [Methanococcus maripaludis]
MSLLFNIFIVTIIIYSYLSLLIITNCSHMDKGVKMKLFGFFGYLIVFLKALGEAWIDVVKRSFDGKIDPEVIEINTDINSLMGQVLLASSITLTPGTLTIDLNSENKTLKVASISPRTKDEIVPFEPYIKKIFD